ncbi:MAG TPA: chemotaxis response regulator protein-glutamate methylesterase [Terriglobales bacterium]|nr:chemotaxis response regulator protein-glutamate methylesterase [Terriglobales bacterium]
MFSEPRMRRESIHVLVVDDSAVVRQVMQAVLGTDRNIKVSVAADPIIAFSKIAKDKPDVVVTDLEMPRMDGLTFLKKIMAEMPMPVVVCSGLAGKGTELAINALALGAVEVITKPKLGVRDFLHESAVMLIDAVWSAAHAKVRQRLPAPASPRHTADAVLRIEAAPKIRITTDKLIAIGASTGGTEALSQILAAMTPECPGIVVVQHMPEMFTRAFAERLNKDCNIEVKEAVNGDRVRNGCALIAPGNHHMLVHRNGAHYAVEITDGPLVSRHRPSVDVLFRSVAKSVGQNAVGVIMTGMGDDGAQGLLEMRNSGARTIAQDEASCVVFGMPREAIELGAAEKVVPLRHIATSALEAVIAEPAIRR